MDNEIYTDPDMVCSFSCKNAFAFFFYIRIFKVELIKKISFSDKKYYHNTSPNIYNEINSIILKLNEITYLLH